MGVSFLVKTAPARARKERTPIMKDQNYRAICSLRR